MHRDGRTEGTGGTLVAHGAPRHEAATPATNVPIRPTNSPQLDTNALREAEEPDRNRYTAVEREPARHPSVRLERLVIPGAEIDTAVAGVERLEREIQPPV